MHKTNYNAPSLNIPLQPLQQTDNPALLPPSSNPPRITLFSSKVLKLIYVLLHLLLIYLLDSHLAVLP